MVLMPTADDAGAVSSRVEFPAGSGRKTVLIVFPLLAAGVAALLTLRLVPPLFSLVLVPIVGGFLLALWSLSRRPTALEVRDKGLVVHYRTRVETIEWSTVRGVEQGVIGMVPMYIVLFKGRHKQVIGPGDRSVEFAREVVRKAGLRWIHEPFSAVR